MQVTPVSNAKVLPTWRRLLSIALYVSAICVGLLAAVMMFGGCRWLVLEYRNGWPFSLSLALLAGAAACTFASLLAIWLARLAGR